MTSILKVDEIQNTDGKTGLVITPDGSVSGVKFPEAVAPVGRTITSTTMSSYEEGTWVPIVAGSTNVGTCTYLQQEGNYTKTGNLVTCNGYINLTAHTGTGDMVITGLPFTQNSFRETLGTIMSYNLVYTKNQLALLGSKNSKQVRFYQFGPSTTWASVPVDTDFHSFFNFTYFTDE